ncbi:MAG: ARMT1-like domain-containing protein [Thermodesulfobacteriota bacterium]|nr:ARMT1-like domain-containing protein [Thermodesulfobacteriota bacterium]
MKTYLDCFPCFLSQALRAARIAADDEKKIKKVLDEVGMLLQDIPLESIPPAGGRLIYHKVSEITENLDPYREIKDKSTKRALSLYPSLKSRVEESDDRLLTAIRVAVAGNVIDFGANWDFDLESEIEEILEKDFAIFDYGSFKDRLDEAREILYIGDNAGECVFDRILIEEINKPVIYVVRAAPVINDATYEDAVQAGIDKVAAILSSGTDAPGTILETCSSEFKEVYDDSKFIISKGQGNYEALSNEKRSIFFLLKTKCHVIAEDIGVSEGDIVLKGRCPIDVSSKADRN